MASAVFAVVLDKPNAESLKRLHEAYSDVHSLNDTVSLVRAEDLPEDVAVTAGIKGKDRVADAVVFKLTRFYAGYTMPTVWDWLGRDEQAG